MEPLAPVNGCGHFAFRHDATVETVRDRLWESRSISLLDCGCGDGSLPRALLKGSLDVKRIRYEGTDQDNRSVLTTRADYDSGAFGQYESFNLSVREIDDVAGLEPTSFDVIVLNNIVHEILTEKLPKVLVSLNSLLIRPKGVLCIVDMEELPSDDSFEPWAITLKCTELMEILRAGGWSPQCSTHPKRVPTYKVVAGPAQNVFVRGIVESLQSVLKTQEKRLLETLDRRRTAQDNSNVVLHLACRLAAVRLSIQNLRNKVNK